MMHIIQTTPIWGGNESYQNNWILCLLTSSGTKVRMIANWPNCIIITPCLIIPETKTSSQKHSSFYFLCIVPLSYHRKCEPTLQ